ncbi:hypothetical protein HYALB_00003271 [Hymenoscyphus albidus]|uniref:Uncharacterized protein n=1 Tax=Hymenoscyphus albidus TaxID=595503 RepID=A0A9N9LG15_9HELO|nr:hypothetical protein HYALB_00003271 [Hymenoscyphus albidus]
MMLPNVDDIVPLISRYISESTPSPQHTKNRQEAMKCYQAWVSYAHRAFIDDGLVLEPLKPLTKSTIMCLADENLYEITMELLSDVLQTYSRFFSKEDFQLLYSLFNSPWAQERYQRLIQGDFDFDSLQFGLFSLAFGDATLQDLTKNTEPQFQQFLSGLGGLLGADGYPVHEDRIFVPALEFWNAFVENMIDGVHSEAGRDAPWFATAQMHVNLAIERCWRKLQFPPPDVFNSWDSVDRTGFKDARRDFADLLQQFYLVTSISILDIFIALAIKSVEERNWAELETSLYCLACFPDNISENEPRDEYLAKIFTAPFFSLFANPPEEIPVRTMQSFLLLVDGYADYFEENMSYLPIVLNIVFGALSSPALSYKASRTILRLCSNCRKRLVPELGSFLQQYQNLALNSPLDKYSKEAIMEGIASLVQAVPDDDSKIAPLDQLLSFVDADIETSFRVIVSQPSLGEASNEVKLSRRSSNPENPGLDLGVGALRSLIGVAKGLQAPDDTPVDLEDSGNGSTFWTEGNGSQIQRRTFDMISRVNDVLGGYGDIVETTCEIWRQGFRELEPGAFVFPPALIAEFILKANVQTPRLGRVIGTACLFVTSYNLSPQLEVVLNALINWVSQLLQQQGEPGNDPEIAQNGIDFLTRLVPKHLNTLMNHQPPTSLEFLFMFTLKALTGSDTVPKGSAAEFWASFVTGPELEQESKASADNVMQHLGPMLAQALIYNISGHAARSELDKLADPLKKLIFRQSQAKKWFEAALMAENFSSDKVTVNDKKVFLQKILNLRGARGTNLVVRDFWLACRGTNFAYTS